MKGRRSSELKKETDNCKKQHCQRGLKVNRLPATARWTDKKTVSKLFEKQERRHDEDHHVIPKKFASLKLRLIGPVNVREELFGLDGKLCIHGISWLISFSRRCTGRVGLFNDDVGIRLYIVNDRRQIILGFSAEDCCFWQQYGLRRSRSVKLSFAL